MDGKYRCGSVPDDHLSLVCLTLRLSLTGFLLPPSNNIFPRQQLFPPPTTSSPATSLKLQVKREIFLEYDEKV